VSAIELRDILHDVLINKKRLNEFNQRLRKVRSTQQIDFENGTFGWSTVTRKGIALITDRLILGAGDLITRTISGNSVRARIPGAAGCFSTRRVISSANGAA